MSAERDDGSEPDKGESLAGAHLDLEVGPVAHGGHCVARHEGRVVFVRHALPGERVRAVVTEGRAKDPYLRADAVRVHEPSPDRVSPPCPYAGPGRCGGCDWQHATLPAQRRLKAAVVAEQMRRLAGLEVSVEVEPVPGSPDGLGWRTRVRWSVDDEHRAGLLRHRSHEVEPIDECRIAHQDVSGVGVTHHRWPDASSLEVSVAPASGQRLVRATPDRSGGAVTFPSLPDDVSLVLDDGREGVVVHGRGELSHEVHGRPFAVSSAGFWQVHPAAADVLADAVEQALEPRPGDSVLDLYAGAGLFAATLAARVAPEGRVTAVESSVAAASDARRNVTGLPVRVLRGRVDRALEGRLPVGDVVPERVDLVVLDPPRAGAGRAVTAQIARREPRRVAYVACDPAAL
ncbi:MAG: class I SAM-dependent RNA methyltransferase, partial [Actinomycetes bacterium]